MAKRKTKKSKSKKVVPVSGYAYELDSKKAWDVASDDDWEIFRYAPSDDPDARSLLLGSRWIDGVEVFVFRKGSLILAQSAINVKVGQ